jgi:hypothetical protein
MRTDARLLLVGPGTVIGSILSAQVGARMLAEWPDCAVAWYLNLQVFRPLRYGIDIFPGDGLAQCTWIAAVLLGLICLGLLLRSRLPLAIAAHLGLVYSALILYCSESGIPAAVESTRALAGLQVWPASNLLATAIVLLSFISSAVAHREYWREIRGSDVGTSTLAWPTFWARSLTR